MSAGLLEAVEGLEALVENVPSCECVDGTWQCPRPAAYATVCNGCAAQLGLVCRQHKLQWDIAQAWMYVGCSKCKREGLIYYVVRVVPL